MNKLETYKFRAECLHDVVEFMKNAEFKYEIRIEKNSMFPDVVVEIDTNETIETIKTVFNGIPDSHVILETIQPLKTYTGERV